MIELHRVSLDTFKALIMAGEVMLPSVTAGFMGFEWLREHGYL